MYTIGADVGGSHISACLFEHSDNVLITDSLVERKVNKNASREEILSEWADVIRNTQKTARQKIKGIGLAMPGPFDYYNGISLIKGVEKFESLYQVNIREALAEKCSLHPSEIRFINDASAFTIAETHIGEARNFNRCVGITLGTGFGACFSENGKPVLTRNDVPPGGFLFDKFYGDKIADEIFSTRGLINAYFDKTGIRCDSVLQLALKAEKDPAALKTFIDFGQHLGTFLLPYLSTFHANVLVIGGNISRASHLFSESLHQQLDGYHIYVSNHGEKAAMIGAAKLLDDDYYKQIEQTLKEM